MNTGYCGDSMEDLTGGLSERFFPIYSLLSRKGEDEIFDMMKNAYKKGSLMCVGTPGFDEKENKTGLIAGHAYTITEVVEIVTQSGVNRLIRLRNPWGGKYAEINFLFGQIFFYQ